jgi:hypothetical protein
MLRNSTGMALAFRIIRRIIVLKDIDGFPVLEELI